MKPSQSVPLRRVEPVLARARNAGAAMVAAMAFLLGGCGGGNDDEAGTPLVPVTPSSASSAEAASAPAASAQR
jgi:hypothetical protein